MEDVVFFDTLTCEEQSYYTMHPIYTIGGIGLIVTEFVLVSCLLRVTKYKMVGFYRFVSKNIMLIYVLQWVMIGLLTPALYGVTELWMNIFFSVGITVTVILLVWCKRFIFSGLQKQT
ncbi:MAG: hypothetical protein IJH96_01800 [Ruminococcus sp.]|nr:hypothetical protein [Ruminococcus sp.]